MQMLIPYGYTLRKAREEDIDGVINVNSVALPEHYTHSFYTSIFSTNPDTFLVIEYNGRVVAYHMGRIEYGFSFKTKPQIVKKGHIISIAVLEEHRRKGLATALLQRAIEEFKKHGCETSFLEVRVSNDPAISMYKKLGYHVAQRIRGYYNDGEDAYVMEIDLKNKNGDRHNN
ncbi:MAG: ribosomal protein S18-alanine N-acetyltransferase [Nitrososphaeria archaeon]